MKLTLVALALLVAACAAVPEAEPEPLFLRRGWGRFGGRRSWGRWGKYGRYRRSTEEEPEMKEDEEDKTVAVFNPHTALPYTTAITALPHTLPYAHTAFPYAHTAFPYAASVYQPYSFPYTYGAAFNAFNPFFTTTQVVKAEEAETKTKREAEPIFGWAKGYRGSRYGLGGYRRIGRWRREAEAEPLFGLLKRIARRNWGYGYGRRSYGGCRWGRCGRW